jgi:hypothetical protein
LLQRILAYCRSTRLDSCRVCERITRAETLASLTVAADDQAAERLGISLNRLNEIVLGEAGHHGRHGAAVLAASENVAAAVDAAAG